MFNEFALWLPELGVLLFVVLCVAALRACTIPDQPVSHDDEGE